MTVSAIDRKGKDDAHLHLADFIDFAHLERYTMGEPGLTDELLNLFCQQLRAWPEKHADERAEREELHRLKGSARAIGAFPLAEAAAWLEKLLQAGAPESELHDARAELREQLDGLKDACRRWKQANHC